MKKLIFLLMFIMLLGSPIYAEKEVVDLQQWVSCGMDYCTLSVDINELPLSADGKILLKNMKHENLVSTVSQLPDTIETFQYEIIDKEKLIVRADIEGGSQNYWFMEFETFILDPWFNSSYPYRQNITLYSPNDTTTWNDILVNITFNTKTLIDAGKLNDTCKGLILWDNTLDKEVNYTLEGCNNNHTQIWAWLPALSHSNLTVISALYGNMTDGTHDIGSQICDIGIQTWYMSNQYQTADIGTMTDKCGLYDLDQNVGDPAIEASYILNGTEWDNSDAMKSIVDYDDYAIFSVEFVIKSDSETGLDTVMAKGDLDVGAGEREWLSLYTSGNACDGNLSFAKLSNSCSESSEVFACSEDLGTVNWGHWVGVRHTSTLQVYVNTHQGSEVDCTHSVYTDGELIVGSMDSVSPQYAFDGHLDNIRIWNYDLGAGEINIMYAYMFEGNMTSGWSEEEYFNGTEPEPPAENITFPVSYTVCYDNVTLITNESLIINGNLNNTYYYTLCTTGCDNITMACNPPQWQQDATVILFVVVCVLIMWLILRRRRR